MVIIEDKPETKKRIIPASNLDLQNLSLEPKWQDPSKEFRELILEYDHSEKDVDFFKNFVGVLQMYTRDARLGNLSKTNGEFLYCTKRFAFTGELLMLKADLKMSVIPALLVMNQALSVLELSTSKGGFGRQMMNTIREENISEMVEPPKRGLFMPKENNQMR